MNPRNDETLIAFCRNHPDEPVSAHDMGDGFCTPCFIKAWNQGAAHADAHWADDPVFDGNKNYPHSDIIYEDKAK